MRYSACILILLQIVLPLLSCNTATQPGMDCTKYRTGKFYYHFALDDVPATYNMTRADSTQQEIDGVTGDTTTLQIKWLSDCTYELRFLKSTEALPDSALQFRKSFVTQTTIESGNEKYYISHTKNNKGDEIGTDTIWLDRQVKPVRVR